MLTLEMKTNQTPYIEHQSLLMDRVNQKRIPHPAALTDAKNFDVEPKPMHQLLQQMISSCLSWNPEDRPPATDLLEHKFFHPSLFQIDECKVTFEDTSCKDKVHINLITNVKSSRETEFDIDLRKEKIRDIAKEFASAFQKEILKEYPDSLEQDIADMVHGFIKRKVRDAQKELDGESMHFSESRGVTRPSVAPAQIPRVETPRNDNQQRVSIITRTNGNGNGGTTGVPNLTQRTQTPPPGRNTTGENEVHADVTTGQAPVNEGKLPIENLNKSMRGLGDFEVIDIMVQEGAKDLCEVKMSVQLTEKGVTRQIDCDFDFGKDNCIAIATGVLQIFKDDMNVDKFPKHVELLSQRMNEALKENKEMYNKRIELDTKMGLQDMLIKAGITDQAVMNNFIAQDITAADLTDGTLREEDLKELIPKLGPRRRLVRIAQAEQIRQASMDARRNTSHTPPVGNVANNNLQSSQIPTSKSTSALNEVTPKPVGFSVPNHEVQTLPASVQAASGVNNPGQMNGALAPRSSSLDLQTCESPNSRRKDFHQNHIAHNILQEPTPLEDQRYSLGQNHSQPNPRGSANQSPSQGKPVHRMSTPLTTLGKKIEITLPTDSKQGYQVRQRNDGILKDAVSEPGMEVAIQQAMADHAFPRAHTTP
mmetsp:Transcript_7460/g.10489  ORF Transcript_7460/g.10489 Transcript_7460/m.10489 type:complete len:650 (+) Transcript_7460:924-2873(+)